MATISVVLFGISSLFLHKLREDLSNVRQFSLEISRRASKMNSRALESEIARGYHFPLEAIIFSPRLSFSPRGYHFPLEVIIFPSRLSFSPRGYHFPLEAIIFPSRLSFSPGGYHFPLEAIIFPSRRLSSKSRTVAYTLIASLFLRETGNNQV